MAKSPNWTVEELDKLKTNYPTLGKCAELQNLFPHRNLSAICLKASRIGLKVINNIRAGRSNEEYLILLKDTNFEALETYRGSTNPILHRCKICSHEWPTRPQHVLKLGAQCPICDLHTRTNNLEYVDSILDEANILRHSEYQGSLKPLVVEHLSCGYIWETKFSYIQQGSGCPLCNRGFGHDFSKENLPKRAKIYLLKISVGGEVFLKVGVTVRTVEKRIRELRSRFKEIVPNIEIVAEYEDSGINVLKKEQYILSKFPRYETSLVFDGKTELLTISVLEDVLKEFNE